MDLTEILGDAVAAAIGPVAAAYALAAVGLNLHYAHTGLLNFGQAGFMLVGAYGAAVTVAVFGGPLWLGFLVGCALAVGLALLVGISALRLRPVYLAIVTVALAEILVRVVQSGAARPFTGGVFGLAGFAGGFYDRNPLPPGSYQLLGLELGSHERLWALLVGWGLVAGSSLLVWLLLRTPWGRALQALRDDEDLARSVGKDPFVFKLHSLVLGAVFGALAGVLLALHEQTVHAVMFTSIVTLFAYTALVLGGAGRTRGPLVGAVALMFAVTAFDTALAQVVALDAVPDERIALWFTTPVVVATVLVALLLLRPQGLLGRPSLQAAR